MNRFWLIQRGRFQTPKEKTLISPKGLILTDYMGSSEFEGGALQSAYATMMDHMDDYDLFGTGIVHMNGLDDLVVFGPHEKRKDIISELQRFCENPYRLQEYALLAEQTQIWNVVNKIQFRSMDETNFWWEISPEWNFMCFFSGDTRETAFLNILQHHYDNWWRNLSGDEREKLLENSYNRAQGF